MLQTFASILDQHGAISAIQRAFAADRLPHGLLFAGPPGVGKFTTASALGALFLCQQPTSKKPAQGDAQLEPCGQCESCRLMAASTHPDFHVITKELIRYHDKTGKSKGIELSIQVLRPEMIEPANRKPVLGRGKVFIIRQADVMNLPAQNSILKTLEEPAGRTIIILLTDQVGALLPTVRSRCQLIRFVDLPREMVLGELRRRGIDDRSAASAAEFAEGSLGLALKWIEDGVIAPAQQLVDRLEKFQQTGRGGGADLPAFFKQAADAYAAKQIERDELGSKDQATREGLALYLRLAANYFRRRLLTAASDNADGIDAEQMNRTCNAIDAIARAEMYLDANVNVTIVFQQLTMHLATAAA